MVRSLAGPLIALAVLAAAPLPLPLKSALRNHNAARVSSSGGLAGLRTPYTGKTLTRVLFLAAALALLFLGKADSGEAANITVNIGDNWFCDPSFAGSVCPRTILTGDTITWSWVGGNPHSSTACNSTFTSCGAAQGWDSGIKSSGTFVRTFNSAGTFFYHCSVHGSMRGRLDVSQDSDGDSWSDAVETALGTNPVQACAATPAENDEPTDSWPLDTDDDRFVDTADIASLSSRFGLPGSGTDVRYDLNLSGFIDTADIAFMTSRFGEACVP